MFWLKRQSDTERKISQIHNLVAKSFANVKRDTQNLFHWVHFLNQKNLQQENKIRHLELELSYIPKRPEDIRRVIDSYYSFESITERIKALNEKIDRLKEKSQSEPPHPAIYSGSSQMEHIENRLKQLEEQRKSTIREKVVQRVTRNSREYVKSLILSYIRKYGQIGALQLKDMVVHDQGLCSKSSFYRMLDDIGASEEVSVVRKGKQKYYLSKQLKEQ